MMAPALVGSIAAAKRSSRYSAAGILRFSGARPSLLDNAGASGFGRLLDLRLFGLAVAFFAAPFLSPLPSVFFFFTPTALPDALRFFGPW